MAMSCIQGPPFTKTITQQWIVLFLLLAIHSSGQAAIKQSDDKIVGITTQNLVETMPFVGVGIPANLVHANDCYLLVTAGAAYTDIKLLTDPSIPAPRVAADLSQAVRGTPYDKDDVIWSSDDYSAAQIADAHGRMGAWSRSSSVPIAAIIAGVRHAGYVPHILLRVPKYATVTELPSAPHQTKNFRWYGEAQIHDVVSIHVNARAQRFQAAFLLLPPCVAVIIGLVCLLVAVTIAKSDRDVITRRKLFGNLVFYPFVGSAVSFALMPFYAVKFMVIADLWLGDSNTENLWGIIAGCTMGVSGLVALAGYGLKLRLVGKPEPSFQQIHLDPEEEAIHNKMRKWQFIPHLLGGIGVIAVLFLVPHRSPYYPYIHPLTSAAPALFAALVAALYRKPLAKFTKKTVDPDLTWFARDIGKQVGVRVQDVFVVESSRAAQVAELSLIAGNSIVVTQKFKEAMTPEEVGFLITSLLIQHRLRGLYKSGNLVIVAFINVNIIIILVLFALYKSGVASLWTILSRIYPLSISSLGAVFVILALLVRETPNSAFERGIAADLQALAHQGDLTAAQTALAKMIAYSAYRDPANAARTTNPLFSYPQRLSALQQAGGMNPDVQEILQAARP